MTSADNLPPSNRETPKPDRPLLLRLYASPHLVELLRLFGDREISKSAAQDELQPLIEKFGQPRMEAAADEVLIGRDASGTTWFRLTDEVRRLAAPLLGSQPVASVESCKVESGAEPSRVTSSTAEVIVSSDPPGQEHQASTSISASVKNDDRHPAAAAEHEPDGFRNFESFLLHSWLTSDVDLCNSLVDAACEDLNQCPEMVDMGWSLHDAAVHCVAESLRDYAEQEAFARTNADPELTRKSLDRIEWRAIASALLYE